MSWPTVSSIAMRAVAGLIAAAGSDRLAGVRVIGVDTEGKLAPHAPSTYRLEEIAAHRASEKGRTLGKIAIEIP